MNYVDALELELAQAGIPARRRARIIAEFADHLHEDAAAELGAPRDLARQFADELGTRLARAAADRAFVALALSAVALTILFFEYGRTWGGWVGYGHYRVSDYLPWWWVPLMIVCCVAAQLALAAGGLAALRAWRLRHEPVITAADAVIINRRTAVALVCGATTMALPPLTRVVVGPGLQWVTIGLIAGLVAIVALLALLPSVLAAARLRPAREGAAGDLMTDLAVSDERVTPLRIALALSALIIAVMLVVGVGSDAPVEGLTRGLVDGFACMIGFTTLGSYLGLRATS